MKASKVIDECVFSKLTKVERLDKLDNFGKNIYSEYETGYISITFLNYMTNFR